MLIKWYWRYFQVQITAEAEVCACDLNYKFLEDFMLTKTNGEAMKVLPWLPRKCLKFLRPRKFGKTRAKKDGLDELIGTVKMIWLELTEPPIGFSWSKYLKRLEPYISRLKRWNSKFDRFQNHKHVSFSAILLNPSQDHSQSVDCVVWNFLFWPTASSVSRLTSTEYFLADASILVHSVHLSKFSARLASLSQN